LQGVKTHDNFHVGGDSCASGRVGGIGEVDVGITGVPFTPRHMERGGISAEGSQAIAGVQGISQRKSKPRELTPNFTLKEKKGAHTFTAGRGERLLG